MVLELLWKLLFGSRELRIKVYRAFEEREGVVSRHIVYENVQPHRFVQNLFFSDRIADCEPGIIDVCDALNALKGLRDVPLLMDTDRWLLHGAESIDEAVNNAAAVARELYEMRTKLASPQEPRKERAGGKLRVNMRIKERTLEDLRLEEQVHRLANTLWKKAGRKSVSWLQVESTAAGRQCYVLMIDGREEHRVP